MSKSKVWKKGFDIDSTPVRMQVDTDDRGFEDCRLDLYGIHGRVSLSWWNQKDAVKDLTTLHKAVSEMLIRVGGAE